MSLLTADHAEILASGIQDLRLDIDQGTQKRLLGYLALLAKWNKAYNLTAVRDLTEMVSRHLLDSLSIVPAFRDCGGEDWLDVGSGGGMPGVPLAILHPDKSFSLLDSNGKKTRFLTQVKLELQLHNLQVIHSRAEAFQPAQTFQGIISRAFGSLADFTAWTRHLGNEQTHWLAMKGTHPGEELAALGEDFQLQSEQALKVPGCQAQRHLLILRRIA